MTNPTPARGAGRAARAAAALLLLAAALAAAPAAAQGARSSVRVVGSSTVFPFAQAVAEEHAGITGGPAPVVESTGTGGGFKLFCAGLGFDTPDLAGASRPIKDSERALCAANGVGPVSEVRFGRDGVSVAQSRESAPMRLTRAQLFLALAAETPLPGGGFGPNPRGSWREVDPSLPDRPIVVFGPPPTSGTRDAFVELAMEPGCAAAPETAALEHERRESVCARMRTDGAFIEAGENDNLIVSRLEADPEAVGIFGFSFLEENRDALAAVPVDGEEPTPESIRSGAYPLSRPLLFYVKDAHRGAVPGLSELVDLWTSERAIGESGFLRARGLIPTDDAGRAAARRAGSGGEPL